MKVKCSRCLERWATSTSTGLCEVCLYAEATSRQRADEQVAAAAVDREARLVAKRKATR